MSMARSTRSGTGVGPGICRKWRPGRREAFCGMSALLRMILPASDSFQRSGCARRQPGGALILECSTPVKSPLRRTTGGQMMGSEETISCRLTVDAERAFVPASQRQIVDQRQQVKDYDAGDRQQQKRREHPRYVEAVSGFGDPIGKPGP